MKKLIGLLMCAMVLALAATGNVVAAVGFGALGLAYQAPVMPGVLGVSAIDVSALATSFVKFGGQVLMKQVNDWDPGADFMISKNVTQPLVLPKFKTVGGPRPYRAQADTSGNSFEFNDRVLTVSQTKWDFEPIDTEQFRNTYMALAGSAFDPNSNSFHNWAAEKIAKDYLAAINDSCLLDGVYNSGGSATVDMMDGLAQLLSGLGLTPVGTGTLSSSTAVAKVKQLCSSVPVWMRNRGFKVLCSYATFDKYTTNVEATNPFQYDANAINVYPIKGFNATLEARSWLKDSEGLLAIPSGKAEKNLWLGFDSNEIKFYPTIKYNTIELRVTLPVGMQIADPDAIVINDQF